MPLTIPEIRTRLHELADEIGVDELHELAEETRRRRPCRLAPVRSRPIDPAVKAAICAYAAAHPQMHLQTIAGVFNVNPGRVSEALAGFRSE